MASHEMVGSDLGQNLRLFAFFRRIRASVCKAAAGRGVNGVGYLARKQMTFSVSLAQINGWDRVEQADRIRMDMMTEKLIPRGIFHDLPHIHDHNFVADMTHDTQVVCDEHVSDFALLLQIHQQVENLRLDRNVKCRNRLVTDDELRVKNKCAGKADTLSPSAVKLMGVSVEISLWQAAKLHCFGYLCHALVLVRDRFGHPQRIKNRLAYGEVWVD